MVIQVVDAGCQDDEDINSCIGDGPCNKNVPDDDMTSNNPPADLDHHDINDQPADLDYHDINDPSWLP